MSGTVHLFHYSSHEAHGSGTVTLDPSFFGRNPFSKNEVQAASTPRILFYLDPQADRESFFAHKPLYHTTVPSSQIYDLKKDEDRFKDASRSHGRMDIDHLFDSIRSHGYLGVAYTSGGLRIVAWFVPITVQRIPESKIPDLVAPEADIPRILSEPDPEERHRAYREDQDRQRKFWDEIQARKRAKVQERLDREKAEPEIPAMRDQG